MHTRCNEHSSVRGTAALCRHVAAPIHQPQLADGCPPCRADDKFADSQFVRRGRCDQFSAVLTPSPMAAPGCRAVTYLIQVCAAYFKGLLPIPRPRSPRYPASLVITFSMTTQADGRSERCCREVARKGDATARVQFLAERSESCPTCLQTSLLGRTPQLLSVC